MGFSPCHNQITSNSKSPTGEMWESTALNPNQPLDHLCPRWGTPRSRKIRRPRRRLQPAMGSRLQAHSFQPPVPAGGFGPICHRDWIQCAARTIDAPHIQKLRSVRTNPGLHHLAIGGGAMTAYMVVHYPDLFAARPSNCMALSTGTFSCSAPTPTPPFVG
jgi:hypothetical protein